MRARSGSGVVMAGVSFRRINTTITITVGLCQMIGEDAAGFFRREWLVGGEAGGEVGVGDEEADRVFDGVDFDEVAVFDDTDRAAFRGFGGDVLDRYRKRI